ncbi:MAG: hypothetical protein ACREIV_12520, partial [Planctomycetaceae bacterium]
MTGTETRPFANAARRVIRRLALVRCVRLLGRTAVWLLPAVLLAAAVIWLSGGRAADVLWSLLVVPAWLMDVAVWAWITRPDPVAALAVWDERAGRDEMFVSAYWFETRPETTPGERLHVRRAMRRLAQDEPFLRRDLPLPFSHRAWLWPSTSLAVVGGLLAVLLLIEPAAPVEAAVADDERDRAREVAEQIAEKDLLQENEALTEEEKQEAQKLEQALEETAEKLKELEEDETRRDVLAELEQRALEAELLALALAGAEGEELSSAMLEELARHADTTDLANALIAQSLEATAEEAEKLAKRLEQDGLTQEEQERIERALQMALSKASAADLQSQGGQNFD